ncbi:50S ribosomal protein L11 methyltransferase [Facilibium subflavum]|uniref:50S ribosomal protein L11 methyltransferase n=1 Tax=Facilibium subflavum TaxID=2219058 RepID=UPI000E64C208|nr:50S ribosomal protein L11 methyltransferase [Facilibium subflavum]
MLWHEISVTCNQQNLEAIEALLLQLGACSISYQDAKDQPILEPQPGENPLWDEIVLVGLFTEEHELQVIGNQVLKTFDYLKNDAIKLKSFADKEWTRQWMQDFKPMTFGKRLIICPSWQENSVTTSNKTKLLLDPGLAFGTGTHPTTALCLNWLDENITTSQSVIDYGCGSGILAIAAKKLGAQEVIAIDNDPQAIMASKDNAIKNNITNGFTAYLSNEIPILPQVDIVIANILAGILIDLSHQITALVKPGGKLALSGILHDQVDAVLTAYRNDFDFASPIIKEDWALLSGTKK